MQNLNYNKITEILTLSYCKAISEKQAIPPNRTGKNVVVFTKQKFKRMQNYALVYQAENEQKVIKENVFFITITTKQHKNELTDSQCTEVLGKWLELRKKQQKINDCIWWAERQQKTRDIHYHVIIWTKKYSFAIKENVKYFEKYFGIGTNLFNRQNIEQNNLISVVKYIAQYSKKFKNDTFECKISQASYGITSTFKKCASKYIIKKVITDEHAANITGKKVYNSEYVTTIIKPLRKI